MELQYVIWWLTAHESANMSNWDIGRLSFVIDFKARFGTLGHRRLVSIDPIPSVPYIVDDGNPVWRLLLCANMGGTVIKASDVPLLPQNIGVLTDLNCMLIYTCPTCSNIAEKTGSTFEGVEVYKCGTCCVKCDHDSNCTQPFLFTPCNKEGRPSKHVPVCQHSHS